MPKKQVPKVTISHTLKTGCHKFKHGRFEPWVGVAEDKIKYFNTVDIVLTEFETKPTFRVNPSAFLGKAKSKNWQNEVGGHKVYYRPLSELEQIAENTSEDT